MHDGGDGKDIMYGGNGADQLSSGHREEKRKCILKLTVNNEDLSKVLQSSSTDNCSVGKSNGIRDFSSENIGVADDSLVKGNSWNGEAVWMNQDHALEKLSHSNQEFFERNKQRYQLTADGTFKLSQSLKSSSRPSNLLHLAIAMYNPSF